MTNLPHHNLPCTRTASKLLKIMVVPLQEIIDNIYKMLSRIEGSTFTGPSMIQCKRTPKRPGSSDLDSKAPNLTIALYLIIQASNSGKDATSEV